MQPLAYYNEIDPFAAQWLRNLIDAGHIAPGIVDTRSIEEVTANDLRGFTQCHFFAGVGVWSYALRRAGWPDSKPVWTGSCPCQPFSSAGKRGGVADERHLWPAFFHLIHQRRPDVVFGEQVASSDGRAWFDTVQADMENVGYACAAIDLCAAGFGAPNVRQRLFWVANANSVGWVGRGGGRYCNESLQSNAFAGRCTSGRMAHADRFNDDRAGFGAGNDQQQEPVALCGKQDIVRMADAERSGWGSFTNESAAQNECDAQTSGDACSCGGTGSAIEVNGFWRDADWIFCRDGKWRPVEPGAFPLANGVASRVGRLRAYGNAINAEVATAFVSAYVGCADNA
ncbi:DNA cytosine methyltransferase [Dickeya sp. CSL RW240]|uniref:DNA cytosine methyltransferase n=1 Tax=Dickeya sp. CSL RW240 TaxID=1224144 RepID=UPI00082E9DCF|nr:DNA cytosine methyltransferase [Dickeya sp. CSL RW240]